MSLIETQDSNIEDFYRSYSVYMHIVPNGKRYVGITKNKPESRWNNGNGYIDHEEFYEDIVQYGWNNIVHVVLYSGLSRKEAVSKENELIIQHDLLNPQNGYNKHLNAMEQQNDDIADKPANQTCALTLRINGLLRNKLKRIAKLEHKTVNGFITKVLIDVVNNYDI